MEFLELSPTMQTKPDPEITILVSKANEWLTTLLAPTNDRGVLAAYFGLVIFQAITADCSLHGTVM